MKKKNNTSWLPLYLITGGGCILLFAEGILPLNYPQQHLILIATLVLLFWFMQQWLASNRFKFLAAYPGRNGRNKYPMIRVQTFYGITPDNQIPDEQPEQDMVTTP